MASTLAVRLGLLAATLSAVYWIGWPVPADYRLARDVPTVNSEIGANGASTDATGFAAAEAPRVPDRAAGPSPGIPPPIATVASVVAPIDLNHAGMDELHGLPGIGPALAARVIEFRRTQGPFATVDDLLKVKGIGKKRLDRLRGQVTVGRAERREQGGRL